MLCTLGDLSLIQEVNHYHVSLKPSSDIRVWKHSHDDKFSSKSAWNLFRDHLLTNMAMSFAWNHILPTKISIFVWKLWHNGIPSMIKFNNVRFLWPLNDLIPLWKMQIIFFRTALWTKKKYVVVLLLHLWSYSFEL